MLSLLPGSPSATAYSCSTDRTAAEDLLDRAERLLLYRSHRGSQDLAPVIAVFGALVEESRRLQDRRAEVLATSAQRLLLLLQQRHQAMPQKIDDLLLDAVDWIQALLRKQAAIDHDVHHSLERRIRALST